MDFKHAKDFMGVGWKFPIEVDAATGRIKTSEYEDDIKEAIKIIIMTSKGERLMRPSFGSSLSEHVFTGMDYGSLTRIESDIYQSLINWEPRIDEVEVEIEGDNVGGVLNIHVSYLVRQTNNMFNMVYPYFLTEGI